MLAAGAGHAAAVNTLIGAGGDANLKDTFGGSALLEAVGARRRDLVDLLVSNGAELGWDENKTAGELCSAVAESDVALLELYIAGNARTDSGRIIFFFEVEVDVDENENEKTHFFLSLSLSLKNSFLFLPFSKKYKQPGDYDRRRALHIAAADGKLDLVKMLVEKGQADPGVRDRWGATPLLEAVKAKHPEVVSYLVSVPGGRGKELGVSESDLSGLLCTAVLEGDLEMLRLFAKSGGAAKMDAADYDKRCVLLVVCGPRERERDEDARFEVFSEVEREAAEDADVDDADEKTIFPSFSSTPSHPSEHLNDTQNPTTGQPSTSPRRRETSQPSRSSSPEAPTAAPSTAGPRPLCSRP